MNITLEKNFYYNWDLNLNNGLDDCMYIYLLTILVTLQIRE